MSLAISKQLWGTNIFQKIYIIVSNYQKLMLINEIAKHLLELI